MSHHRPTTTRTATQKGAALVVAGLAGMAVLTACSSAGDGASSRPQPSMVQESATSAPQAAADVDPASGGQQSKAGSAASVPVTVADGRKLARSAGLTMEVDDVIRAAARVRSVGAESGGYVSSEQLGAGDDAGQTRRTARSTATDDHEPVVSYRGGDWAEIVVSVPTAKLDSTVDALAKIGTVTHRSTQTEDLTASYTDTASRIKTKRASINRIRGLIERTKDIGEIADLETELSEREGDLESMVGQLDGLKNRTEMAPVRVSLTTPQEETESEEPEAGFVSGLRAGWDSFTGAMTVGATALGVLTPFAVAGALVTLPLVWLVRRRIRRGAAAAAPQAQRAETS